jgi:translation elongation factor EF-Tu-like GTPase
MRLRGADVADVAILVVSAEEGVKPQTLEALASIKAANIPYIVAINKIDKPNANVDRTKNSLVENEIPSLGCGFPGHFVREAMVNTNNQIQNHRAIVCALVFS